MAASLLAHGGINKVNFSGNSALMTAIAQNDPKRAQLVLDSGIDLSITNNRGFNALHYLSCNGQMFNQLYKEVVSKLDVNRPTKQGWTPLAIAAYLGLTDIASTLIYLGADNNAVLSSIGLSPVMLSMLRTFESRLQDFELRTVRTVWFLSFFLFFGIGELDLIILRNLGAVCKSKTECRWNRRLDAIPLCLP